MFRAHAVRAYVPAGNGTGNQESAGLDTVRLDLILRTVQGLDPCNDDAVGPRAGYARTEGVEKVGKDELAGHAWLTCGETVVTGGEDLDRYTELHSIPL